MSAVTYFFFRVYVSLLTWANIKTPNDFQQEQNDIAKKIASNLAAQKKVCYFFLTDEKKKNRHEKHGLQ